MALKRRTYLTSAGTTATAALTCFAGYTRNATASQSQTLELWHDKGQNPNWTPAFEETLQVLNEQVSNLTVEQVQFQSTDSFQGAIRPVLGSNKGPGIFSWWTGQRLRNIIDDGFTYDVTDEWQSHIENGEYSETFMSTFGRDGTGHALPLQTSYWPVWYNKQTFADLGVSPPSTWEEFLQLNADIQEQSGGDIAPIALPLSPPWTGFIWYEELVLRQSVDFYNELSKGEAKYTDDVSVTALQTLGDMTEEGYFGEPSRAFSMSLDDLPRELESRNYAMTLLGDWFSTLFAASDVDFSNYDWFVLPPMNPDVGNQLVVEPTPLVPHAGYPDKETLSAVSDAILSVEFQQTWAEVQNVVPANNEASTDFLPPSMKALAETTASGEYDFPLRYWENTSPDVAVPASKTLKRIYQFPNRAERIAERVEKLRQQVYG